MLARRGRCAEPQRDSSGREKSLPESGARVPAELPPRKGSPPSRVAWAMRTGGELGGYKILDHH